MAPLFKGLIAALLLAGSTVAATTPAQADRGTGAVIAGLFGLGIGAAIASDHHRDRYDRYDERVGYYGAPSVAYYGGGGYGYGYGPSYGYEYRGGRGYGYGDRGGWDRRGDYDRGHDRYRDDRGYWDRDGRR